MAERRKSKRRSSILKSLDNTNFFNDGRHFEKRRVSFSREIMVKEFHKPYKPTDVVSSQNNDEEKGGVSKDATPTSSPMVYKVDANESFYQMSTPIGMKKRRISTNTIPTRLSVIPAVADKSFLDESDFEVFEDESPACDNASKPRITLPEPEQPTSEAMAVQFGTLPTDNFGEPVVVQDNQIVDMSLTLEEDHASLLLGRSDQSINDTMSSTIHPVTNQVDPSILNTVGLMGTKEMDPRAFPVSLLTPPKPPVDIDPAPVNPNLVKELIKEPNESERNETVFGGRMSMTCDTSFPLIDDHTHNVNRTSDTNLTAAVNNIRLNYNTEATLNDRTIPVPSHNNSQVATSDTVYGGGMSLTCSTLMDTTDQITDPPDSNTHRTGNETTTKNEYEPLTYIPSPPPPLPPAQLQLPTERAIIGKRRPILSATAVVSKPLAIGNKRTPKKVTALSQMKSPYFPRGSSTKKHSSVKKRRRKSIAPSPGNYNLRSSPSREKRKRNNDTFVIEDGVDEIIVNKTVVIEDDDELKNPVSEQVQAIGSQNFNDVPHPLENSIAMVTNGSEKKVESNVEDTQEQIEQQDNYTFVNESLHASVSLKSPLVPKDTSLTPSSLPPPKGSPSLDKLDYDWMNEELSFNQTNDLLAPPTPRANQSKHTPGTPMTTPTIQTTQDNLSKHISVSANESISKTPPPSSIRKHRLPSNSPHYSKAIGPSPLTLNEHVNSIQPRLYERQRAALPIQFQHGSPSLPSFDNTTQSSILVDQSIPPSPGMIILDGTINQTVMDPLDTTDCSMVDDAGASRRMSFGRKAMEKWLGAVPGGDVTLRLDELYDQQREEMDNGSHSVNDSLDNTNELHSHSIVEPHSTKDHSIVEAHSHSVMKEHSTIEPHSCSIMEPHSRSIVEPHSRSIVETHSTKDHSIVEAHSRSTMDHSTVEHSTKEPHSRSIMDHSTIEPHSRSIVDHSTIEPHSRSIVEPHSRSIVETHSTKDHSNVEAHSRSTMDHSTVEHSTKEPHSRSIMDHFTIEPHSRSIVDHSTIEPHSRSIMEPNSHSIMKEQSTIEPHSRSIMEPNSHSVMKEHSTIEPHSRSIMEPNSHSIMKEHSTIESHSRSTMEHSTIEPHSHSTVEPHSRSIIDLRIPSVTTPTPYTQERPNIIKPFFVVAGADITPITIERSSKVGGTTLFQTPPIHTGDVVVLKTPRQVPSDETDTHFEATPTCNNITIEEVVPQSPTPQIIANDCIDTPSEQVFNKLHVDSVNDNPSPPHDVTVTASVCHFMPSTTMSMLVADEQDFYVDILENLHSRFKVINDAVVLRMTQDYSSDDDVIGLIKFYYAVTKSCMYALRCVIDFIRLSDMLDSECDMTPIKWEELPHLPPGRSDIKGTLMDKTLWLQTMIKNVNLPLYEVSKQVMTSIKKFFGWSVTAWDFDIIEIGVRSRLNIHIQLENEGEKIKSVTYESLTDDDTLCSQLMAQPMNFQTVLEIPVMMQNVLQYV